MATCFVSRPHGPPINREHIILRILPAAEEYLVARPSIRSKIGMNLTMQQFVAAFKTGQHIRSATLGHGALHAWSLGKQWFKEARRNIERLFGSGQVAFGLKRNTGTNVSHVKEQRFI